MNNSIDNLLQYYSSTERYQAKQNQIPNDAIAFVEDEGVIYTHGHKFGGSADIENGSVTTSKIAQKAVTSSKLADNIQIKSLQAENITIQNDDEEIILISGGTEPITSKYGFKKEGKTNADVLLAGGGTKPLSEIGGGGVEQIQSDWNQTNENAKDYIKNKPTIPQVPEIDYEPTPNSDNLVTSGGVYNAINSVESIESGSITDTSTYERTTYSEVTYYWCVDKVFELNTGDSVIVTPRHVLASQTVWASDPIALIPVETGSYKYTAAADNMRITVGFTSADEFDYVITRRNSILDYVSRSTVSCVERQTLDFEEQTMARENIGIGEEIIDTSSDSKKVYLKKNIVTVGGVEKNVLVQDAFYKDSDVAASRGANNDESTSERVPNTDKIFVVNYDFDLDGETVELPEGSTLEFEGGSIHNGVLTGTVTNKDFRPEWFGAKGDGVTDDTAAIQQCINLSNKYGGRVLLSRAVYKVTHIDLKTKTHLIGVGIGASIIKSNTAYEYGIVNILEDSTQIMITNLSIVGSGTVDINGVEQYDATQDGIYALPATKDGATYNMSYYLQEHTGIENTKQTYRNIIIDNVYVGHCRYGMYFNNYCYRIILTRSDIKRCMYGVNWLVTDGSMHECYIERCGKDGLLVTGSNNNISNIKSIWNGSADPYGSYGMRLRGSRNRYSNLEAQDNYCSGIYTSGNENLYDNIIANGDGYDYDAEREANDGVSLCEWYINTLNCLYNNCEVSSYSNRNDNKFPTYPILYGADAALQAQKVHIIGYSGIPIAREPLKARNRIATSPIFNIDGSKITYGKGYSITGTEGFSSVPNGYNTPIESEITIIAEILIGEHTFDKSIYLGYANNFMGITIRPNLTASGNLSAGVPTSIGDSTLSNLDKTKPIRAGVTSRIIGKDDNNHFIYECSFGIWYYDSVQNGYVYKMNRKTGITSNKTGSQLTNAELFQVSAGDNRNDFYLRQVLVTDTPCVLTDVTYPGNLLYGLNPIISLDYESAHGSLKPAIGDSEHRPTLVHTGAEYFDKDLNRPLWYNGSEWINSNGSLADEYNDIDEADVRRIATNITKEIISKNKYQSGWINFTVKVNKAIDEGAPDYGNVNCGIILPTSYEADGVPTNLVIICHDGSATIEQRMTDATFMKIVNKFLEDDYAVLMCNGYGNTADESAHWGCKRAASGYRKAYEWAVRNYNLNNRFSIYGFSMGGLMAIQLGLTMQPNVVCIALGAPALDLYSCWTTDERKRRFALAYGFTDATVYEEAKTKGCDPFKGIVSISDTPYYLLNLPPVKIWHGVADDVISIEKSRTFVTANNNNNNQVELNEISGGGHNICYGGNDTVTAAIAEWIERFVIPTKETLLTSDNDQFMVVSESDDENNETIYENFIVKV